MRLEIGAGAAAGCAGGVLWSSAILAAISLLGAAFTSRLPAPAPPRCARPRRLHPAAPALALQPSVGRRACGPALRSVFRLSRPSSVWGVSVPLPLWLAAPSSPSSGLSLTSSQFVRPSVCLCCGSCLWLMPSVGFCFFPCFCL